MRSPIATFRCVGAQWLVRCAAARQSISKSDKCLLSTLTMCLAIEQGLSAFLQLRVRVSRFLFLSAVPPLQLTIVKNCVQCFHPVFLAAVGAPKGFLDGVTQWAHAAAARLQTRSRGTSRSCLGRVRRRGSYEKCPSLGQ